MTRLAPISLLFVLTLLVLLLAGLALADDKSLNWREPGGRIADSSPTSKEKLTLSQCIERARTDNFDIQTAKASLEKQYGVVIEARAGLLPALKAAASYDRIDRDRIQQFNGTQFGSDKSWNAGLEVTQPIFAGGRLAGEYRRASFYKEAAQLELDSIVQTVILQVRQRFYEVLLAKSKVTVQRQSVELLEAELKIEQSKLDAGTVSDFEVLRAKVELANAQAPLIKAKNDLRLALEELSRVLGQSYQSQERDQRLGGIKGRLQFNDVLLSVEAALEIAGQNRPELKQVKVIQAAARQGIKIAVANYLPQISLYGGYGAQSSNFSDRLSEYQKGWTAGARASWSIFDSFKTHGQVKQARAEVASSDVAARRTVVDVQVEVRRAFSSLTQARELVAAAQKVIEQAEESYRLARARFDVGSSRQIDVLDTQVALTQARNNQIEALYAFNLAKAELERAIGVVTFE